jgi:outer membrane biosynthesis protein TonB
MIPRKKKTSSKVNLTVSLVFHAVMILAIVFFAAREGILGKKLKEITVTMVPKEKKTEPVKEKPPEPKPEVPRPVETVKVPTAPPPRVAVATAPPPLDSPVAAAPAAVNLPAFEFNDGARDVQSKADPNSLYKGLVERALRSHWDRPEDMADDAFVVEVEVGIDASGKVGTYRWVKGSGDNRWDGSVKAALARTTTMSRPPPKGFPDKFLVRFDVEATATEEVIQVSRR